MRRLLVLFLALVFLGALVLYLKRTPSPEPSPPGPTPQPPQGPPELSQPSPSQAQPHPVFQDYASPTTTAREDLRLLHGFVSSSFLIVKNHDPRQYSTNEDLTQFLRGKNPHREVFLPPGQALPQLINADAQLIDRWGSPLIVHPISHQQLELRSAGPDRVAYTDDDLSWPPAAKPEGPSPTSDQH